MFYGRTELAQLHASIVRGEAPTHTRTALVSLPVLSTCSLAQIRKMGPAVQINIAEKQIIAVG